jgi:hypothetical protein
MTDINMIPNLKFIPVEDLQRDDIVMWKGDPHKVVGVVIGEILVNVYFGLKGSGGFRKPDTNMIRHVGEKVAILRK